MYYSEPSIHTVSKIDHDTKAISIVAGVSGVSGSSGDGGVATSGLLYHPAGLFGNSAGVLYIADQLNHKIRCVSGGMLTTVAGNGVAGNSGDSGSATSASLNNPVGVFQDGDGILFIVDRNNSNIRAVNEHAVMSRIAGSGVSGMGGDDSLAVNALLSSHSAVFKDTVGSIYVADKGNNRIRKLFGSSYVLPTPSPTVTPGPSAAPTEFSTDYFIETIVDTTAGLKQPGYIYGDTNGNIYFTEQGHHHIRLFSAVGGLSTIAGNGTAGYNGAVGTATYYGLDAQSAMLNYPSGIFVNPSGYVYFCDTKNNRVRYAGLQFNYYSGGIFMAVV